MSDFFNAIEMIRRMMEECYDVKEISVDGKVYSRDSFEYIDFFKGYFCMESSSGDIMFFPYDHIDWITLKDMCKE